MLTIQKNSGNNYTLQTELLIASTRLEVFEFFSNAQNLEVLIPPLINFRILTPLPITMQAGALIDYRLKLHGISFGWRTEITAWEPPFRFVDTQLRGPYKLWIHEHTFEERDGGTLMRDKVDYSVTGGALIHWLFVCKDLRLIFEYRQKQILSIFSHESQERVDLTN